MVFLADSIKLKLDLQKLPYITILNKVVDLVSVKWLGAFFTNNIWLLFSWNLLIKNNHPAASEPVQEEAIDSCIPCTLAFTKSEVVNFNDGALEALENKPLGPWSI